MTTSTTAGPHRAEPLNADFSAVFEHDGSALVRSVFDPVEVEQLR